MKRCNKCEKELPTDSFPARRSVCQDCYKAQCAEYRANNVEDIRARDRRPKSRFSNQRCQARKRGLSWDLTLEEFSDLIKKPCHYCEGELNETGSALDRVDMNDGYRVNNVVPCCDVCNTARSSIFTSEEMQKLGAVITDIRKGREKRGEPQLGRHTLLDTDRAYRRRS